MIKVKSVPVDITPVATWKWYGNAGHLIVGEDCRFHLCTEVGKYLVSTVGQWLPDEGSREIFAQVRGVALEGRGDARRADYMKKLGWKEIGAGRTYETMVFRVGKGRCKSAECGCGQPFVETWSELDADSYNDAGAATHGHYALCRKYASMPVPKR